VARAAFEFQELQKVIRLALPANIELPESGATTKDVDRKRKDVERYLLLLSSAKALSFAGTTAANDFLAVPDSVSPFPATASLSQH
jgi:hypothetical protein